MNKDILQAANKIKEHCKKICDSACEGCFKGSESSMACPFCNEPHLWNFECFEHETKESWKGNEEFQYQTILPDSKKESQNRTYNLIEIFNFPIGTKFEVLGYKVYIALDGESKILKHLKDDIKIFAHDDLAKAEFTIIKKPVSFMEVVQAKGVNCRVEHRLINTDYAVLGYVLKELGGTLHQDDIRQVIQNGKWYLEGGN